MRKLGIVLSVFVLSVAAWGTSASALNNPQLFNLLDVSSESSQLINGFAFDRAPRGGDQFAISDDLYKWAGTKRGARAGRVQGIGTFQTGFGRDFSQRATVLFVAQAYLKGGSVLIQGYGHVNPKGPSKFTLPVLGGTGIYANVRGFVIVRDLGNGDLGKSNVEIHLLP